MEFEKKVPVWNAEGTEPPESLKTNGFQGGYRPPAPYFNWFWHAVSKCLEEIQASLSNVNNTADTEKYVKFAQEALEARGLQNALTMRLNGGRTEGSDQFTFNGETGKTVNITPDKIGAADADLSNVDTAKLAAAVAKAGGGGIPVVAAESVDGVAYTAIVSNVTELTNGMIITIIPAMTSASTAPTLNVNGLGAVPIRLPLSTNNAIMVQPESAEYYVLNRPIVLQYDAGYLTTGVWKTVGKQRPSGSDIYGTVSVANGGTGADNAAAARANLGITAKKTARFVVGTSQNGWTAADCDYLCDGVDDQEEINAAIAAISVFGGDVVLLDGAYYITGKIEVSKIGVTLQGSCNGTILNRNYDGNRLIDVTADNCVVRDLTVIGNSGDFTSTANDEIYITGNFCTVQNVNVSMSAGYGICLAGDYCKAHGNTAEFCYYGISIDGSMCTVTGNTFNNNDHYGINLCETNNVVTGNVARFNTDANMRIFYGRKCTVVGNDFSVYDGDSGTTSAIYTSAANNTDNIVTNNNVGIGTVSVQGSGNIVGNPGYTYGTTDLTAGSSELTTGQLYFVYE